jgi:hypothetical protein
MPNKESFSASDIFVLSHQDIKTLLCYTALRASDCSVARDCPQCPLRGVLLNKNVSSEAMELAARFSKAKEQGIKHIGTVDRLGVQILEDKK